MKLSPRKYGTEQGSWISCIDNGDIVGSLFLDLRKAFNVIDQAILIEKLAAWFKSHLNGPKMSNFSEFIIVNAGVPRGYTYILDPIFFLLFINDLPLFLKYCYVDFFADDATIHINSKVLKTLKRISNRMLRWKQNKMHINFDKTTYLVLGTRYTLQDAHFLIVNHDVKHVSQQKIMCLHIDDKLSFTSHIDKSCSAISSKISLLQKLSTYVKDILSGIYTTTN